MIKRLGISLGGLVGVGTVLFFAVWLTNDWMVPDAPVFSFAWWIGLVLMLCLIGIVIVIALSIVAGIAKWVEWVRGKA